jgi:hypothetical protein
MRFVIQVNEEMPDDWGLIFGDILSNLRAALDHAVYNHAMARQPLTPRQEKSMNYPVVMDETDWPRAQTSLAQFVDPAVLNVIYLTQPFQQPIGGAHWHPLAILNGLVNRDKHRSVRPVLYTNEAFIVTDSDLDIVSVDTKPVEMTDGAIAATVTLRMPPKSPTPPGPQDLAFRAGGIDISTAYVENIEVPTVNVMRPLLFAADELVNTVEDVLEKLEAAGC